MTSLHLFQVISANDFSYNGIGEGTRGVFNWQFYFQFLPLRPGDQDDPTEPFQSPVMMGCVFAISTKFFWELGESMMMTVIIDDEKLS
jgi:polypeptide N-acetylgalactosaminyltransferase